MYLDRPVPPKYVYYIELVDKTEADAARQDHGKQVKSEGPAEKARLRSSLSAVTDGAAHGKDGAVRGIVKNLRAKGQDVLFMSMAGQGPKLAPRLSKGQLPSESLFPLFRQREQPECRPEVRGLQGQGQAGCRAGR